VKHVDSSVRAARDNFGPFRVPRDHLFMMGDNRDASRDSRFFGPVPFELVIAKADVLYFSFNLERFLPRLNRIGKLL
jgi:signal peptidase I